MNAACLDKRRSGARRLAHTLLVTVLAASLSSACASSETSWTLPFTGPPDVAVDTPELREAKKAAGIEGCPAPARETNTETITGLPQLNLPCFGGGRDVQLSSLDGPRVISVWAQWCEKCRNKMPVLQAFHEQYGAQVPVLGIDFQDPQVDLAMEFLEDTGARYPQVADLSGATSGLGPFPGLNKLPFLMIIDGDGEVVLRQFVVIETVEQLRELVETSLPGEL